MKKNLVMNKARVQALTKVFPKRKILVFGDVGVDCYTIGNVSRISPEAPIPVLEVKESKMKLGLASNVAENIEALGGHSLLAGIIGKDNGGKDFVRLAKDIGMTTKFLVQDSNRRTTLKERVVAEFQQVVRIDYETQKKISGQVKKEVLDKLSRALSQADAVIIEDYCKGLVDRSFCKRVMKEAKKLEIPVFVDPNLKSSLSLYEGCTLLTPNRHEAEMLSGVKITDVRSLRDAGRKILAATKSQNLIITRGKDGMAVFMKGKKDPVLIPTFAREVFDVSGAGDTTIATLALAYVSGADLVEAALLANYAAGVVVAKRGTATVNVQELKAYVDLLDARKALKKAKR